MNNLTNCLECKSNIIPNKHANNQKFCCTKCKNKYNDRLRYKRHKDLVNEKSLKYYHNNKEKVLKKQIAYKKRMYQENKIYHNKDNIRKFSSHNISLENKRCEICNSNNDLQRHHEDYSKPLDIKILCRKCHNKYHETLKRRPNLLN